ncbi:Chondrolectin [Chelonia mydas]|uniref:Chondrolectin n=1 Tax=Chelonia mydas TaxID=8469 RepID=M7AX48_CHEMY|nr:Chondrolectin [Chelonia mydas]
MLQNLTKSGSGISDGDFWIGLWRSGEGQAISSACPELYQWTDGTVSSFSTPSEREVQAESKGERQLSTYHSEDTAVSRSKYVDFSYAIHGAEVVYLRSTLSEVFPSVAAGKPYDENKREDNSHVVVTETVADQRTNGDSESQFCPCYIALNYFTPFHGAAYSPLSTKAATVTRKQGETASQTHLHYHLNALQKV